MPFQQSLLTLLLAAPAAGGAAAEEEKVLPRIIEDPCRRAADADIVVCGRRDPDEFRLKEQTDSRFVTRRDEGLPVGIDIGGNKRLGVTVDEVQRPDGTINRRAMVHLRVKF